MPYRKTVIVAGEIYHIFNRSVAKQPIFLNKRDYQRAVEAIDFYRLQKLPIKFSRFKTLPMEQQTLLITGAKPQIEILAYCIMPNHVHFLIKPIDDKSISKFMNNFQHSYSNYFNVKNKRVGALFQSMFKAVRIETEEQLIHFPLYSPKSRVFIHSHNPRTPELSMVVFKGLSKSE